MEKITTSFKVDRQIYKKFKLCCITKDMEFAEGISQALTEWCNK